MKTECYQEWNITEEKREEYQKIKEEREFAI